MMTMVIEIIMMMTTEIAMTMMTMAKVTAISNTCQGFKMKMVTI